MNETWWITEEDMDDDQYKIIELPPDGNFLVTGPPGSGKTNLLLLRAKFMTLAGLPNVAVVVLTRSLRDFLASGASRYGLHSDNVQTSVTFYLRFLREHGVAVETSGNFEAMRAQLIEQVRQVVESNGIEKTYDSILLDEAQDFMAEEIEIFAKLAIRLFAVADLRQSIYRASDAMSALALHAEVYKLRHHYRNGLVICRFADALAKENSEYDPMENSAAYDETARPSSVESFAVESDLEQVNLIATRILLQMQAYPQELLGILVPLKPDVDRLWELLRHSPIRDVVCYGADEGMLKGTDANIVLLSNIHDAKGLEFRAVHIASAEGFKRFPKNRNLAFTAATRAKTSLSIYHVRPLLPFIEGALAKTRPLPDLPKVRDLFGGDRHALCRWY